jgi:hypothetical protein
MEARAAALAEKIATRIMEQQQKQLKVKEEEQEDSESVATTVVDTKRRLPQATSVSSSITRAPVAKHVKPLAEPLRARGNAPHVRQLKHAKVAALTDASGHRFYVAEEVPGMDAEWMHALLHNPRSAEGDLLVIMRAHATEHHTPVLSTNGLPQTFYVDGQPREALVIEAGNDAPRGFRSRRSSWAILRFL